MRFAVVTDSTCDVPIEQARARRIDVVPLSVSFGTETMPDMTLSQDEFFHRMARTEALPTTSQPPVGLFVEAYERALQSADEVISIHISSKLSGTIESARQAADRFAGRVHVFDSRNLSWALAFQVFEAATAAAEGLSVDAALERLESVRRRVRLIVGLDSLENLAKGGRIGKVSAFLGSLLDLKITFTVDEDGAFAPVGRHRGEKAALSRTLDWVATQVEGASSATFAVGYALQPERADWLAGRIRERFGLPVVVTYATGSVIASHTGTGWGVAVLPDE